MFGKCIGMAMIIFGLVVFPLSASMVSFLVVEEGLPQGSDSGEYSSLWEGGLMGAFFDTGHIVSNSPVMRVDKLSPDILPAEVKRDYTEARSGGANYFLLAVLEFSLQDRKMKPYRIHIKIFTTDSENLIYENRFPAGNGVNLQDEYTRAQETARTVAAQIKD